MLTVRAGDIVPVEDSGEQARTPPVFARDTAVILGSQISRSVSLLVAWAVVARTLGADALGQIQLAYVFPFALGVFLSFGLPIANTYFLGKRLYPISQVLGNNLIWSAGGSFAAILVLWLGRNRFAGLIPIPAGVYVATLVWIPLQLLRGTLSSLLIAEKRFSAEFRISWVQGIVTIVAVVFSGYLFRSGVEGTVWLLTGLTGAIVAYQLWLYRHVLGLRLLPDGSLVRQSFALGLKGYFGNMIQYFNYRFDVFVVGYFSGTAALGLYAAAYTATELLWYVPQAAATVLMPATAGSTPESATRRTSRVCRMSVMISLAIALVAAVLAPWGTRHILGEQFVKSLVLIWVLLPGVVAFVCAKILAADLSGRGRPEFGSYAALGGLVVTVVCNLLLVPRYGPLASAAVSSAVYAGEAAFLVICYCSLCSVRPLSLLVPKSTDLAVISRLASLNEPGLPAGR